MNAKEIAVMAAGYIPTCIVLILGAGAIGYLFGDTRNATKAEHWQSRFEQMRSVAEQYKQNFDTLHESFESLNASFKKAEAACVERAEICNRAQEAAKEALETARKGRLLLEEILRVAESQGVQVYVSKERWQEIQEAQP